MKQMNLYRWAIVFVSFALYCYLITWDLYLVCYFVVGFCFASFGLFRSPGMVARLLGFVQMTRADGTVFSVFNRSIRGSYVRAVFLISSNINFQHMQTPNPILPKDTVNTNNECDLFL